MRKLLRGALARAVGGVAILTVASAILCHNTLHVPRDAPTILPGSRAVTILARDHVMLAASFIEPRIPNGRCVLALHGVGDTRSGMDSFATMLVEEQYSVLLPDSRAHGESGGDLITYGLLEKFDTIDWAHWLRQQGCERIYGLGESLGGAVLIQAAAVEPAFRAIVSECPYASLEGVAEYRVGRMTLLPAWAANPPAWLIVKSTEIYARLVYRIDLGGVSPVTDIAHTSTPVLLIHGREDRETPPSNSEALARANSRAVLWLVPNAGHVGASLAAPEEFRRRVLAWFSEN